jgi:hypothetical protein
MIDPNQLVPLVASAFSAYSPDMLAVLVLPPLTDVLNTQVPDDNEWQKFLVSVVACFFIAAIVNWHTIMFGSPQELLTSFGLIFTASQALFKLYFKDSLFRNKLQGVLNPPQPDPVG